MSRNIIQSEEKFESGLVHRLATDNSFKLIIVKCGTNYGLFSIKENRLVGVNIFNPESMQGKIIIARVLNVKNVLGAAFVKLSDKEDAFIKLSNVPDDYFPLHQGDLLPVKLISEAQKGKKASVTAKISKKALPDNWMHKSAFTVIETSQDSLAHFIRTNYNSDDLSAIVTDCKEIYDILNVDTFRSRFSCEMKLYSDDKLSLTKLYSLKTKLQDAASQKVFLKSGGYLIINHTEALIVIDVNSGKNSPTAKTEKEENILRLNIEAAKEIALQMQLRNMSGMILIDFINMESDAAKESLIEAMKNEVENDSVKTMVIDITPLGIMEITRQKKNKPLNEMLNILAPISSLM